MAAKTQTQEQPSKREAILEAARALFGEKGYEDTTIADIAKKAGIAVGTVYLYFRNKHEVYTAVALDIEAMIADAFQDPSFLELPFEKLPRAMLDATFRVSHQHQHLMTLLQIDMQSHEEVQQHKQANDRIAQSIDRILRNAVERGEMAPCNTAMYAQLLSLLGGAIMHQCYAVERGEREELYRTYSIELFERLFFGPSLREGERTSS